MDILITELGIYNYTLMMYTIHSLAFLNFCNSLLTHLLPPLHTLCINSKKLNEI